MKTAMTVDQWSEWLGDKAQTVIHDANGDALVLCRAKAAKVAEEGGTHHATAAAALHNKSFGFTHADVAIIERALDEGGSIDGMGLAAMQGLESLRDRIAALLAPAKVTA